MTADRWVRLSRGLGALLALLALLVGVPVGLAALAGWPLPHGLPTPGAVKRALSDGWRPDDTIVVKAVAVVCWAAWAELVACAVVEVRAALHGRRQAPRVPLAGPLQTLVASLVATVVLATTPTTTQGGPARPPLSSVAASPLHPPSSSHVARETAVGKADIKAAPTPSPPFVNPSPVPKQVVVKPRDNLWRLAQRHLGDPLRWREIWDDNRDRPQPDGRRLVHPHLIRPGWILDLPADAVGVQSLATTRVALPAPPPPQPADSSRGGREVSETPPPSPNGRGDRATPPAPSAPGRQESPPDQGGPQPPSRRRAPVPPPVSVDLPSGSVVATSFAAGVASAVALGRLRRRRRYRPAPPQPALPPPSSDVGTTTQRLMRAAGTAQRPPGDGPGPSSQPDETGYAFAGLDDPAPARVEVGVQSGEPVEVDLVGLRGLALSGPGAADVARALVAALLAKGGPLVNQVIVPHGTAARLLPGLGTIPGLRVVADVPTALTEAEVEMLHRSRLLEAEDTPDFGAHRLRSPDDPLPAVVLVVDDDRGHQGRVDAVASLGGRLGVGPVVLDGGLEFPVRLTVEADGRVSDAAPQSLVASLHGATLYRLREEEGVEVARILAASREDAADVVEGRDEDVTDEVAGAEPQLTATAPLSTAGSEVRVQLLGPYTIEVNGNEVRTGLRSSARELLAYYLLRPKGASAEAAIDALWPDADLTKGSQRFWTALGNLRSRLRKETEVEHRFIDKDGEIYRVEQEVFDVDLWCFQAALDEAAQCPDDKLLTAVLSRAVAAYGGHLLEGSFYEWVEPMREELRRRALDVLLRLSELRKAGGDLEAALSTLERAIGVDPYAEELYRRAMFVLSELGRPEAARRLFRQLEERLAELDLEPEGETVHLVGSLLLSTRGGVGRGCLEGRLASGTSATVGRIRGEAEGR